MEKLVHRKVKRVVQYHTTHMNPHFLIDFISPPPSPLFFIHTLNTKKQNFSVTNRTYKVLYGNENEVVFFFFDKLFPNWIWNNRLIPNSKRSMSRLYIVTLVI